MIIRWLQNVFKDRKELDSSAVSNLKEGKENSGELVDLAHQVLSKEAKERQALLYGLEHFGHHLVRQRRLRQKIKYRVKSALNLPLSSNEEEDIAEEITERFAEVAEVDPFVGRLFLDSEKTK